MFGLARLTGFHAWLQRRRFWGHVTFRYKAGEVTGVRCEQEFKPDALPCDPDASPRASEGVPTALQDAHGRVALICLTGIRCGV